jgi:hypothetical protein
MQNGKPDNHDDDPFPAGRGVTAGTRLIRMLRASRAETIAIGHGLLLVNDAPEGATP